MEEYEGHVSWMAALDAFEREYHIPNPYRREEAKGQSWAQRVFNFGLPENIYPNDRVAEMLAFVAGYAGNPIGVPPLKLIGKAVISKKSNDDIKKMFEAHRKGRQSARQDTRDLELRIKSIKASH